MDDGFIAKDSLMVFLVVVLIAVTLVQGFFLSRVYRAMKPQQAAVTTEEFSGAPGSEANTSSPKTLLNTPLPKPLVSLQSTSPGAWNPFEEFQRMEEEMDRLFDQSFNFMRRSGLQGFGAGSMLSPSMDLQDNGDTYVLAAELPGAEKADIAVNVEGRMLTIRAETRMEEEDVQSGRLFRQERRYGTYERSVYLPGPVDSEHMKATYEDGVLRIELPKAEIPVLKQDVEVL